MKRHVVVLCALAMVMVLRAQEAPAAAPAAQPAAAPAVQPAPPPAAAAAVQPAAAPANADLRQQMMDLRRQVDALEREARRSDPTLGSKLDELEKQRRQVFVQAKPELEALYAQQDVVQEKTKELWGKRQGADRAKVKPAGEAKPGKEAKAARKAEKQAEKKAGANP